MSSSAWPVHVALATAISADAAARTAVGRTGTAPIAFSGSAPANTPLGYYTLGDTGESEQNVYARRGSTVDVTLHAWASTAAGSLQGWAALEALLHRRPLALGAGVVLLGQARLVMNVPDAVVAGQVTAWHAVVRYSAVCRGA